MYYSIIELEKSITVIDGSDTINNMYMYIIIHVRPSIH